MNEHREYESIRNTAINRTTETLGCVFIIGNHYGRDQCWSLVGGGTSKNRNNAGWRRLQRST